MFLRGDLTPEAVETLQRGKVLGVDTETTGLHPVNDKLALVQVSNELGDFYAVQVTEADPENLRGLLESYDQIKVIHYARFDVGFLAQKNIYPNEVACTKVAAKILDVNQRSSLKDVLKRYLDVDVTKDLQVRVSDWTSPDLTPEQMEYARKDTVDLPRLWEAMSAELKTIGKYDFYLEILNGIPYQVLLDIHGYYGINVYGYK